MMTSYWSKQLPHELMQQCMRERLIYKGYIMKVFKVTYVQGSNKSACFLATNGQEMKQYFQSAFPGLPELKAESFGSLKAELATHNFVITAEVEPNPMSSLDALAEVNPDVRYGDLQLRSFVARVLKYDTLESMEEYQRILAIINKKPIMGSEVLALIR